MPDSVSFPMALFIFTSVMLIFCITLFSVAAALGELWYLASKNGPTRWSMPLVLNDAAWAWFNMQFKLRRYGLQINEMHVFAWTAAYMIWVQFVFYKLELPLVPAFLIAIFPALAAYLSSGRVVSKG